MPKNIDWVGLSKFEVEDHTRSSQEYSCTSDKGCEIVDIAQEINMEEEFEKRFYCDNCGHNFCMEVDEDMPQPKFCIFCASPVFISREEEYDDDEDEFY